jgi:DNA-binding transcriptional MerR regulator
VKGHYKISDFAEIIGKHTNTVDRWFNDMERRRIHYVNRSEDGVKVYDDLDLSIANFIRDRRDENWNLPAIYNKLEDLFDLRPFPDDLTGVPQVADFEAFQRQFSDQIQQSIRQAVKAEVTEMRRYYEDALKQLPRSEDIAKLLPDPRVIGDTVRAQVEEIKQQIPKPRDPVVDRQERVTDMITRRRVEAILRRDALHLWSNKPENERIKRTGLFGLKKEEDHARRDQFVSDYIDEHFETRLKNEYDL